MPEDLKELKCLAKPLVDYLRENHDPYTTIVIEYDLVQLFRQEMGMPFPVPGDTRMSRQDVAERLEAQIETLSNASTRELTGETLPGLTRALVETIRTWDDFRPRS